MSKLKTAVIGAGAFGRNHLRVLAELDATGHDVALAAVVDANPATAQAAAEKYGIPAFSTVEELLAADLGVKAAAVAVPTVHHASTAAKLLVAGVDLLIEKPLAANLQEADQILALAAEHDRIVQPGHLERFNPAVLAARAHIHRPMFFESHRLSIFTPRSLDVDVVLDLMIHDLDIVLSFVQSPVREVRAVGLPVLSRKVDIANVRLEFENGCIANFTASRVSTETVRKLRFFQPRQYLSLDFARRDLLLIDVSEAAAAAAALDPAQFAALAAAHAAKGGHPTAGLNLKKLDVQEGEPLRLEIESFLNAVRTRTQPQVTAHQGRAALALALEINVAIATHAQRAGL
ncbi:Predicted dehydrogenase [Granulicella pectinivorans]|jgi:predicted dehydrogenase|uniref:Predicted dehydrogenase n=1 Tax=Granulicella pectinivorans TaxID=474950 RepID=A0A1I6LEM1_9BACT|nr:Gfo/Idh/MocA family oxidoreductase [Granulicella pectinivorans]SFS01884.1 Predicted dehydrogenase [Granulicella pectinivorans]